MRHLFIIAVVCLYNPAGAQLKQWAYLPQGPGATGFKTMRIKGKQGDDLLISIWYPAYPAGSRMRLKDYIAESKETPATADTTALNNFKKVLELPFLFHLDKIPQDVFNRAITTPLFAYKNAPAKKGRFPLILTFGMPVSYPEIFEFFASHGFVVASVSARLGNVHNDTLLYVQATNILEELMYYMVQQPYIDTAHIAAFGHGWGIQAPFYLAMRTPAIKQLINLDGGVFGPRSKTTLSPYYHPSNLKIPMLHIICHDQAQEDDTAQFNILTNPRYVIFVNDLASHQDFTEYGRVVNEGLHKRGEALPVVEKAYAGVQDIMLHFLQHNATDSSGIDKRLFTFKFYNNN